MFRGTNGFGEPSPNPVSPTTGFVENQAPSQRLSMLGGSSYSSTLSSSGVKQQGANGVGGKNILGQAPVSLLSAAALAGGNNGPIGSSSSSLTTTTNGSPNSLVASQNKSAHVLSPAGFNPEQQQRVNTMIAASASGAMGSRLKALELFHYWASTDAVVKLLEDHVNEALKQGGVKVFSPTSDPNSASFSPKAPVNKQQNARSPHTSSLKSPSDVSSVTVPVTVVVNGVDDDSAPMEQPPALQLAVDAPREDMGSATLEMTVDDLPRSMMMSGSMMSGSMSLPLASGVVQSGMDDSSPRRRQQQRHPKSPRSTSPASSFHGSQSGHNNLTPHYHIVDEVDAAHARGALSPRSISPAMQLNQDMTCVPQSPMEMAPPVGSLDFGSLRRSPSAMVADAGGSNSLNTTPRRPGDEHGAPGRPSRSPSPAGSKLSEDLAASRASSSAGLVPTRKSSAVAGQGNNADAKPKYATYQEIPRFYFAEGKPQTQSTTLVGPHSNKHENPHLTIFEGVAVPVGAQAQLLLAQQQMQGGGFGGDLSSLQPQGPKLSAMLPLAVMEDEDVLPFIQREFARLPAPPPKAQPTQQQRATKGASVLRRPTTSQQAPSKQEQAYRQALTATMHRVCTQAFGLPRYLGQLVFRKLTAEAESAAEESITAPPSRPGTSSGSITSGAGSGAPAGGSGTITVLQVKEFYEKHLRFKSIVRRMFEVLIATSKAPGTLPAGALGGAMSGMAPAAIGAGTTNGDHRRNYLIREDFSAYLDVLLEQHPGLGFLRQTQDFQGKYMETVMIRIFYDLDRLDRGRITWPEFENSKLPDAIRQVDATEDINTVLNYFSYEHFYVLYCRFWELDEDRDMLISQGDLQKYSPEGTINPKIVERIFQGHGRKLSCKTRGKMNYEDFVWFCLSEEDKSSPRAIRYWFRILDLDGDGILCGFELETFYGHTKKQLLQMTTEGISFSDVICQVADMLPFSLKQGIRLGDMLAMPQAAHVALNMMMNVVKFLQFEQRDPFVVHHERLVGGFERNDWDRFARMEYDRMAQEADGDQ